MGECFLFKKTKYASIPQPNYALQFSSGDYVNLGNLLTDFNQDTPFAFELWVKSTADDYVAYISSQMPNNGKGIQFGTLLSPGSRSGLRLQGDARLQRMALPDTYHTGEWMHLATTYNGSRKGSGIKIFHNGENVSGNIAYENQPGDMTTTNPTYLGVRNQTEIPFFGEMDDVRVWRGTIPTQMHIAHFKNRKLPLPYCTLFERAIKKFDSNAHQGIATDGTYIYVTDNNKIYKYTMSGTLVDDYAHGITGYRYEDFCVVDGVAYVPLTNFPTTNPRLGKIQKINITDMSLITTINLNENTHPSSLAFKDNKFWMSVTEDDSIKVYNENFELQKIYTFPVIGEQCSTWPGYSGLEWIGNYLYGNKHEDSSRGLDVAFYNDNLDYFKPAGSFNRISSGISQGMAYDAVNDKMYWVAREHNKEVWESDITGGLIGYWKMNEGEGNTITDSIGGNHGTISGATWITGR